MHGEKLDRGNLNHWLGLKKQGKVNTGKRTLVCISGADEKGEINDMQHRQRIELFNNFLSVHGQKVVANTWGKIINAFTPFYSFPEIDKIYYAHDSDVYAGLQNPEIKNIILIGHASHGSWVGTNGVEVTTHSILKHLGDHLKNGFFMNMGCNQDNDIEMPLGLFAVKSLNKLLGTEYGMLRSRHDQNIHIGKSYDSQQLINAAIFHALSQKK